MVANQLALRWEILLHYLEWANIITRVLVSGRGSQSERTRDGSLRTQPDVASFEKMRKRLPSQEMQPVSRSRQNKEAILP